MCPKILAFLAPSTEQHPWDWDIVLHLPSDRVTPTSPGLGETWSCSFTHQGLTCFFLFLLYRCHQHWYTQVNVICSSRWVWISPRFLASAFEEPVISAEFGICFLHGRSEHRKSTSWWSQDWQSWWSETCRVMPSPQSGKVPPCGLCWMEFSVLCNECRVIFLVDPTMQDHLAENPRLSISHVTGWNQHPLYWGKTGHTPFSTGASLLSLPPLQMPQPHPD